MRYWTICYPDRHPTQDFDIDRWETLSDQEILDSYWDYWSDKMLEKGPNDSCTYENCITDWCIVHWAARNRWREIKEYYE